MKQIKILFALTIIFSITGYSQPCNCMEEYKWIKKTFADNDAGYFYYIEKYGQQAIDFNNKKWETEFKKTADVWQCNDFLNAWIKFYRKGHLTVAMTDQTKARPAAKQNNYDGLIIAEPPALRMNIDSF